jgi:hypothetical protein
MLAASNCNRFRVEAWVAFGSRDLRKAAVPFAIININKQGKRRGSERGWAWHPLLFVIQFEPFGGL